MEGGQAGPVPSARTPGRAQLKAFFTGQVKNWKEVGGPDAPVELVTVELSTGSGTADFFREVVMEGAPFAPTHAFEQPREILSYVASHPHAVSWGTLVPNAQGIKVLPLDGVAPTPEAIRTADYPLSGPLVLATRGVPEGTLKDFLDYVMSPEGQAIVARFFIPVLSSHVELIEHEEARFVLRVPALKPRIRWVELRVEPKRVVLSASVGAHLIVMVRDILAELGGHPAPPPALEPRVPPETR